MTAKEMWAAFTQAQPTDAEYEAWAFGDDADTLARLVLEGAKTATASAYPLYALEGEDLPKVGDHSVVLDAKENAVCVIRSTRVYVTPYHLITADHARKEGEGDRSLGCWRKVHEAFFREEMSQAGLTFTEDMPVVCEEFEVLYP